MLIICLFILMVVGILFVEQGQRRIPIQFAKRIRGPPGDGRPEHLHPAEDQHGRGDPGDLRHLDPVLPGADLHLHSQHGGLLLVREGLINVHLAPSGYASGATSWFYIGVLFFLIVFFTYFYTAIQFDPARQSR